MVNVIKIKLNESTVYKYIDTPMMKKVVSYYIIDNDEETQANEWHMTINSEEELRKFAEEQERLLDYDYEKENNIDEVIEKTKIYDYAIKLGNKYFKNFVYSDKNTYGRFTGGATRTGNYETGDIIDIELSNEIEYTTSRRNISEKIQLIYDIDKFKNKEINIIPV